MGMVKSNTPMQHAQTPAMLSRSIKIIRPKTCHQCLWTIFRLIPIAVQKFHLLVNDERQGEFPARFTKIGCGNGAEQQHRQAGEHHGFKCRQRFPVRHRAGLQVLKVSRERNKFHNHHDDKWKHAQADQQSLNQRAEKKLRERAPETGKNIADLRRFAPDGADEKIKYAADQRPGDDKVRNRKQRADNRDVGEAADLAP